MIVEPPPRGRVRVGRWMGWAAAVLAVAAVTYLVQEHHHSPRFLRDSPESFVATFPAPPPADSAETRRELAELLALQATRAPGDVSAAQADRKTRISRFAEAVGMTAAQMDDLEELPDLAQEIEDDVRPFVRAAKWRFQRLRPYVIEPRLQPCIGDVRDELSYPSGHATYGFVMTRFLAWMVPERATQLEVRGQQFARQRMVCGVHFGSDIEAGRQGAAWLAERLLRSPEFQAAAQPARRELRTALGLPVGAPQPAAAN